MAETLIDLLKESGYHLAEVPTPVVMVGCVHCGREVEAIAGCCIRCAVKSAPMHWDGPPEEAPDA